MKNEEWSESLKTISHKKGEKVENVSFISFISFILNIELCNTLLESTSEEHL